MIFNTDLTKKELQVIFRRKTEKLLHPILLFNNIRLYKCMLQQNLVLPLDIELNQEHMKNITQKLATLWPYCLGFRQCYQDNACLTLRCMSFEKIYQKLGLESLKLRRWFCKLCYCYKIFNEKPPSYLFV